MRGNSYPTDLSDAQWRRIADRVPQPKSGGRLAKYLRREIVNAILCLTRNGCAGRSLPHDFPSYCIVFHYFRLKLHNNSCRLLRLMTGQHGVMAKRHDAI